MKSLLKKIIPDWLFIWYHKSLAILANVIYWFPSRQLIVIGVTGTKGKSTVANMIWQVLTAGGYKVGMTSTANIRVVDKEWINDSKMTMPGRFKLQRLLRRMVRAGCQYAVVETSSEGIKQYRHWGIRYQVGVFTNLTPEHIEAHGSFANYKKTKGELFKKLRGQKISILNVDDEHVDFYKSFSVREQIYYSLHKESDLKPDNVVATSQGFNFEVKGRRFNLSLLGEFNLVNAMAAIAVGKSQKLNWQIIVDAIHRFRYMPGRMEEIKSQKGFSVIVDYAHTPESLVAVYQTIKPRARRLIAVLGSCGGGRDKAKRPILGKLAGKWADVVIVTNEDPYDEDPEVIIDEVWQGLKDNNIQKYRILDRGQAIAKAISLAQAGDIVIITGKGSEQWLVTAKGKIAWDDRQKVKEIINK